MNRTRRRPVISFLEAIKGAALGVGGALALASSPAAAQPRGAGPTIVGLPLEEVPVGSWAEYTLRGGDHRRPQKVRHALVAKEAGAFTLESAGRGPGGARTITRALLAADPMIAGGVKQIVVQLGAGEPMEVPAGPRGADDEGGGRARGLGRRFLEPDPRQLVGKETIKVAAGTFEAQHYRHVGARGGVIDFWIAPGAGPLGLVKLQSEQPSAAQGQRRGLVTLELAARGTGAKPEITKPVRPFDPEAMRGFWGGGASRRFARPQGAAPDVHAPAAPKPSAPAKTK